MKSAIKMLGVTLLEIMLVLAIAAMVIVMSVRYYQSATISNQTNAVLQQIQAITAAMDSLAAATGDYDNAKPGVPAAIGGAQNLNTPWGTIIGITSAKTTYTIGIPLTPAGVCANLAAKLKANPKITVTTTTCTATGEFTYSYDSTK